jgi:hypothetical protein
MWSCKHVISPPPIFKQNRSQSGAQLIKRITDQEWIVEWADHWSRVDHWLSGSLIWSGSLIERITDQEWIADQGLQPRVSMINRFKYSLLRQPDGRCPSSAGLRGPWNDLDVWKSLPRPVSFDTSSTQGWTFGAPLLRPILNLAPRDKLWPQGRSCPLGVKLSPGGEILCSTLHSSQQ